MRFCVIFLVCMIVVAPLWASQMTVSGEVSGTWSVDTVFVTGDLLVPIGQTLTIAPGAQVRFGGCFKLVVQGMLTAVGSPLDSIVFTRGRPSEDYRWRGIRFDSAANASILQFCRLEWAKGTGASPGVRGGAVWIHNCSPTLSHCLLINNYSHNESFNGSGGGVCLDQNSNAVIENCSIIQNQGDSGGGVCVGAGSHGIIRYCRIENNHAFYAGGGIYVAAGAEASIYNNTIRYNSSAGYGGGGLNLWSATWLYGTTSDVYENLIAHNSATDAGGGIYSRYDASRMHDNTIINNSANRGAGLYVLTFPDLPPILFNSVVWGNTASVGPQIMLDSTMGSTATISYCAVLGGWSGPGMLDQYPNFVDTTYDDYRLAWPSPCVDHGDPNSAYNDPDSTRADIGVGYFDQSSPVRIMLTPHESAIIIDPSGGAFNFTLHAMNITDVLQPATCWINLTLPNGQTFGPVLGPVQVSFPPNAAISRVRTQIIPPGAPTGIYYFNAFAVAGADTSTDSFLFFKQRSIRDEEPAGYSIGNWADYGEEFNAGIATPMADPAPVTSYVLQGASPNPFNSTTVIRFSLPQAARVKLEVFDTAGRNVSSLSSSVSDLQLEAGTHEISVDGTRLPSGVYIYRLTAGGNVGVNKIVLIK